MHEDNAVCGTQTPCCAATPLAAVAPLTATPSGQSATLTWTAIAGASGYNIYRCTTPGGEAGNVLVAAWTGSPTTGYTDTTVTSGQTYYYKVTGEYGAGTAYSGESTLADCAEAEVIPGSPPDFAITDTPNALSVVPGTTATSTLTLTAVNGYPGTANLSLGDDPVNPVLGPAPGPAVVSWAFAPSSLMSGSPSSTLTLSVGNGVIPGVYNLSVIGADSTGTPTHSVPLTLTVGQPPISLSAYATGSQKITLYWSILAGAAGYDVYRSTNANGPFSAIASGVNSADPGPGVASIDMYNDTDPSLVNGTDYYYYVVGVDTNQNVVGASGEDDASPDPNAVPWDTGNAAQIISSVSSWAADDLYPTVDSYGDSTPVPVGVLTVCGPDGVLYQGNYPDGSADASYPPAYYDTNSGQMVFPDGERVPSPSPDDPSAYQPPAGDPPAGTIGDTYSYPGNYTGIWREVESQPGAAAFAGVTGLPNPDDSSAMLLATGRYPNPYRDSRGVLLSGGPYSDAAFIYSGGVDVARYPVKLDAGLMATQNFLLPDLQAGWEPYVQIAGPGGQILSAQMDSTAAVIRNGVISGCKILAQNAAFLQFQTPDMPSVKDKTVVLSVSVPSADVVLVPGELSLYNLSTGAYTSISSATEVIACPAWRKGGSFSLKRIDSIAQTVQYTLEKPKTVVHPGFPVANGPAGSSNPSFLTDGSFMGSSLNDPSSDPWWGVDGDDQSVMLNFGNRWVSWTNDASLSLRSGAYPLGGGYVSWADQNPFWWEDYIDLNTQ